MLRRVSFISSYKAVTSLSSIRALPLILCRTVSKSLYGSSTRCSSVEEIWSFITVKTVGRTSLLIAIVLIRSFRIVKHSLNNYSSAAVIFSIKTNTFLDIFFRRVAMLRSWFQLITGWRIFKHLLTIRLSRWSNHSTINERIVVKFFSL